MASQVSTILAVDEPGIALATALGLMLGKRFYFASERQLWHDELAVGLKYFIGESGERRLLWIPKDALKSRKSTLLTAGVVTHPALFKSIHRLVTGSGGYLAGICAIASPSTILQELKPHLMGEKHVILTF
jgi:adenine/guanine phosphoribosyltransferase-like PRPP-binding protein